MKEISSFHWVIYIRSDLKKLSISGVTAKTKKKSKETTIIKTKSETLFTEQIFLFFLFSSLPSKGRMKSSLGGVVECDIMNGHTQQAKGTRDHDDKISSFL